METSWVGAMPTKSINDWFLYKLFRCLTKILFNILPPQSLNRLGGNIYDLNYISITNRPQLRVLEDQKHQR